MRTPSWLVIVPLFVIVWLMAMLAAGWPGGIAQASAGMGTRDVGHNVALSQDDNNNNNNDNSSDTDDSGDNDSGDNADNGDGDNSSDGSDDNDNRDQINVVPVPVPVSAPAAPAPTTSADQISQCLSNGGTLVYQGPQGGIVVTSYQDNLNVTLARVDQAAQPAPPAAVLSTYIFRMSASPCGGAPYTVLPVEANLAVSYTDELLAAGRDESRFALMYYDGTGWTVAPKLFRDAANNHVSASVTGLGVYALVQQ